MSDAVAHGRLISRRPVLKESCDASQYGDQGFSYVRPLM
jgi:hypothetical protein